MIAPPTARRPWRPRLDASRLRGLSRLVGYGLSAAVPAALAFFSIPLMIRVIGLDEFGRWALLEPLFMVLPQLAVLGLNHGTVKQISADDAPPWRVFVTHAAWAQPALGLVAVATAWLLSRLGYTWTQAACFAGLIYVEAVLLLLLSALRGAGHSLGYSVGTISRSIIWMAVLLAAAAGAVTLRQAGDLFPWWVLASGLALAASLGLLLLARGSAAEPPAEPPDGWRSYRDGLRYGLPLLVGFVLYMTMMYGSRFVLDVFADTAAIGAFAVYLKLSAVVHTLVVTPFALWWPAERFRRLKAPDEAPRFFRRTALTLLLVLLIASGGLYLVSGCLMTVFAPQLAFAPAVMLPLVLSTVFAGLVYALAPGLLDEGRTHLTIYINGLCAVAQLALCWWLIPRLGIVGAAWAAALCSLISLLLSTAWSQRLMPVPYDYGAMLGLLVGAVAAMAWLGQLAGTTALAATAAVVAYVAPLAALLAWHWLDRPARRGGAAVAPARR
jgi:O-antigen/teichoic acid export membrane protein